MVVSSLLCQILWCYFPLSLLGFISNISTHRQYFPDEEDATGAAKALMRLQDTYQLDSEVFARGTLPGEFIRIYYHVTLHDNIVILKYSECLIVIFGIIGLYRDALQCSADSGWLLWYGEDGI